MQDKAIGPGRGTSTWTAAKKERETRCFQLLGFLFLFAKPLRACDDPREVTQLLTPPPPHACTHPRAHRRWWPPYASSAAIDTEPSCSFRLPPPLKGERAGNPFRLLLNCCLYDNDFFLTRSLSLSLSLFTLMQTFSAPAPPPFADRFQTIASCRPVPFVPLSCTAFSTQVDLCDGVTCITTNPRPP